VATLILYPAIDLKDGECVRVVRGDLGQATVFNADPADQARTWANAGFHWLHVVDLNGAVEGKAVNAPAVEAILQAVSVPVQLGGGIRTLPDIERWIEAGVSALIVTDIDRDGTTLGFDVEAFGTIADAVRIPVIAAGGLASVEDILRLKARGGTPIAGAVLGRALYNGAIVPAEALKVAA
jgi:phosphoribosylformimino-5-aminoimidazole carboxamide ribonucleotide (ProFAR) isomerase